jgi:hypothetical protein
MSKGLQKLRMWAEGYELGAEWAPEPLIQLLSP